MNLITLRIIIFLWSYYVSIFLMDRSIRLLLVVSILVLQKIYPPKQYSNNQVSMVIIIYHLSTFMLTSLDVYQLMIVCCLIVWPFNYDEITHWAFISNV